MPPDGTVGSNISSTNAGVVRAVVFVACVTFAFYVGTNYQSQSGGLMPDDQKAVRDKGFTVQLNNKVFCSDTVSMAHLHATPLDFVCTGVSQNILTDFSWVSALPEDRTVAFDIHRDDGTVVTGCCGSAPVLALHGTVLSGTLAQATKYSYLGLGSYLDALKIGLAQKGFITDPFTIVVPGSGLTLAPTWAEGLASNQTWDFIKVQDKYLYVVEVTYVRPDDGRDLSMKVFLSDPVSLGALPVAARFVEQ